MSIIDNLQDSLNPSSATVRAKTKADKLKTATVNTYRNMLSTFIDGAENFWNSQDATPQEIADQLGTEASGVFYLHARLGEVLALVDPTTVSETLSIVGEFTQNGDGTVTVIPPPSGE